VNFSFNQSTDRHRRCLVEYRANSKIRLFASNHKLRKVQKIIMKPRCSPQKSVIFGNKRPLFIIYIEYWSICFESVYARLENSYKSSTTDLFVDRHTEVQLLSNFIKTNNLQHVGLISLSAVHLFSHKVTLTVIIRHSQISHS